VLLIFGNVTSGKTELGRKLVREGFYDVVLEADDFWRYVSGLDHPWRREGAEKNPKVELHRVKKNEALALAVQGLTKHFTVVVSGLWPHESAPLLQRLQDYEAIVLSYRRLDSEKDIGNLRDVAAARFVKRGNSMQDFKESGAYGDFERNEKNFSTLAANLRQRGRLLRDPKILSQLWEGSFPLGLDSESLALGGIKVPIRSEASLSTLRGKENGNGGGALGVIKPVDSGTKRLWADRGS
jgi:hypothetical protein